MKYISFIEKGLRETVKSILASVSKEGLEGNSHFYITFCTKFPNVQLSREVREKYPERITIVIQHDFYDLAVFDTYFQVKLSFSGKYELVKVPFESIYRFEDPSESFGLEFTVPSSNLLLENEYDNVISIESLRNKKD